MSNSDQCNAVKDDCSYTFRSIPDSNPLLDDFLDEWKDELYRKSTILRLNDDCFYHIIKFLPVIDLCALRDTCSRLRSISDYCFEKRSESFRLERNYVSGSSTNVMWLNDAKRLIQNFGQFITKLSVEGRNFPANEDPSSLVRLLDRYCFKLKDLTLAQINLKPETISQCERLFSNMHRLVIDDWKNEEAIDCCLAHCGSLKQLKFINFHELKGKFLTKCFESLESFTMINCGNVVTGNVRDFLAKNGQLKRLTFIESSFIMLNRMEADVVITLPNLESLCLQSTNFMHFLRLMKHIPTNLKRLEVDLRNLQHTARNSLEILQMFCERGMFNKLELRLCEIKSLKILRLTNAHALDPKFYQNAACQLPVLSEVHFISSSTKFSDIKEFVQHSTNLEKIVFLQDHTNRVEQPLTKTMLLSLVKARLQNKQNKEKLLLFLNKDELADIYREFEKNGSSNLFVEHADVIKLLPWTLTRFETSREYCLPHYDE